MDNSEQPVIQERIDPDDIAQFKRIQIPLVRRIYPSLIANKIVSVQPLSRPTGLDYYMRFRYSSNGQTEVVERGVIDENGETKPFPNQVTIEEVEPCPSRNTTNTT